MSDAFEYDPTQSDETLDEAGTEGGHDLSVGDEPLDLQLDDAAVDGLPVEQSNDGEQLADEPVSTVIVGWEATLPLEAAVVPLGERFAVPAGPDAVGLLWCAPTGESSTLEGVDCNGDGVADFVVLDANGDGIPDTWLLDTTGKPSPKSGAYFADTMYFDSTHGAGVPDCGCRDPDGTGAFSNPVQLPPGAPPAQAPAELVQPPAPAEPAQASVAPAEPGPATSTPPPSGGFIDMMGMTDDPDTQAALMRMWQINHNAGMSWL